MKKLKVVLMVAAVLFCAQFLMAEKAYADEEEFEYEIRDGYAWITDYVGDGGAVVIPATIDGYSVLGIESQAFYEDYSIESITLSEGIKYIQGGAIWHCFELEEISLPSTYAGKLDDESDANNWLMYCPEFSKISIAEENPYYEVVDNVMYTEDMKVLLLLPQDDKRTVLRIPEGVKDIGGDACHSCENLKEVIMPNTVERILAWAFCGARNLEKMNISTNCTVIGSWAITYTKLKTIHIPSSMELIIPNGLCMNSCLEEITVDQNHDHLYVSNGALCEVYYDMSGNRFESLICYPPARKGYTYTVPDSVQVIDGYAFAQSRYLMKVILPDSIERIDGSAFGECYQLEQIFIPASAYDINENAFCWMFEMQRRPLKIYGPSGTCAQTLAANKGFTYIVADEPSDMGDGLMGWNQAWDGNWYYFLNGVVDTTRSGIIPNGEEYWYAKNGKADFTATLVTYYLNDHFYVKNGKVDFTVNTIVYMWSDWYCVFNGVLDLFYEGLASNEYGTWYVDDGTVNFSINGFAEVEGNWYYFKGGALQKVTGVYQNGNEWWYVENGQADFTANTVASNDYGWWYVRDGKVDFTYHGLAENPYGIWYIENGQVDFNLNGFVKMDGVWLYFQGGALQRVTGVYQNGSEWWYVENGEVDFTANTVASNAYGWWYVRDGKVDFTYDGIGDNVFGTWYIENGQVDFSQNGVLPRGEYWYYFQGGAVQYVDTVASNAYGWWYVNDGVVDFTFHGIAGNDYGLWYCKDGCVDFSYNGTFEYEGKKYNITNGLAVLAE